MWYVVYRADGTLQSTGTAKPDEKVLEAKNLSVKEFAYNVQAKDRKWNPATSDFDTVVIPKRPISVAEFKTRLTLPERAAIIGDAKTDDTTAAYMDQLNTAGFVKLDDAATIDLIDHLVSKSLIKATRKAEILS